MAKRYYVYALIDPETEKPFYVGKGNGLRARQHLMRSHNQGVNLAIQKLRRRGKEPQIAIIAKDLTESEAFDREQLEIATARAPLCNVQPGRLSWEARQRAGARALIGEIAAQRHVSDQRQWAVNKAMLALLAMTVLSPEPEWYDETWFKSLTPRDHARLDRERVLGEQLRIACAKAQAAKRQHQP